MGNWIYTDITIGGTVSVDVAKELRALIEAEFDGENSGEIVGGHLFACGQRNYGNADEVEDFCVENGLPYVLTWEDGGDFGPGGHAWRPGMEKAFPFDGKDGPGISLVELKRDADAGKTLAEIIEALSIGDASTLPPYVEEAGPDAYEIAAREAGWREYEHGVFHPASNDYADDWRAACGISKVGPDHPGQVEAAPASPPSVADVTLEALRLAAERIEMNNYGGEEDEALATIRAAIAAAQGKEG